MFVCVCFAACVMLCMHGCCSCVYNQCLKILCFFRPKSSPCAGLVSVAVAVVVVDVATGSGGGGDTAAAAYYQLFCWENQTSPAGWFCGLCPFYCCTSPSTPSHFIYIYIMFSMISRIHIAPSLCRTPLCPLPLPVVYLYGYILALWPSPRWLALSETGGVANDGGGVIE